MKAMVCTKYGSPDVLQLQDDEILIKIHAASINARDWRMMRAKPFFIRLVQGGFLQPKNKVLRGDVSRGLLRLGDTSSNLSRAMPFLSTYPAQPVVALLLSMCVPIKCDGTETCQSIV